MRENAVVNDTIQNVLIYKGSLDVSTLAKESFVSTRQLERLFHEYVGITPKKLSNLIRYQFLWRDILYEPDFDVLSAVHKFGYTDQSHLLREFKRYYSMDIHRARRVAFKDVGNIQDDFVRIWYNSFQILTGRRGRRTMKYCTTVIAVRDMEKSLQFYKDLFNQDVLVDLGKNKTLTCGLALQQGLEHIAGFDVATMKFRSNTMELYFETEDFDAFMQLLDSYPQVERLHEPRTFAWLQRGIHIFDPDGHLIEVSESMYSVACKQFKAGKTIEETAKLVQHPIEVVRAWYKEYKKEWISVCGTDCSVCYCFGKMCNGCNSCEGKVFHAPEGKACPIYDCVRNSRCMQNCGECGDVPCKIWFDTRDPKFSDEEFNENVTMRVQALKKE